MPTTSLKLVVRVIAIFLAFGERVKSSKRFESKSVIRFVFPSGDNCQTFPTLPILAA